MQSLQQQLDALRGEIRSKSILTASTSSNLLVEGDGELDADAIDSGGNTREISGILDSPSSLRESTSSILEKTRANHPPSPVSSHVRSRLSSRFQQEADSATSTPGTQRQQGQILEDASGDSQVYGATSLFHDQTSKSPLTNSRYAHDSKSEDQSADFIKDRLIAYSAVQRQQEIALRSSPSITANIDFDNVPIDLAMHLLDLHWNRQHLSYLLTYRPAIMDSLIKGGPYMNKLLLNAIYLQSSLYSDRPSLRADHSDPQMRGEVFFERFNALLGQYIAEPSIPTIVALLTCGACLVPHGKQSAGWVYCGIAYRMITDLGCHLDMPSHQQKRPVSTSAAIDAEFRRRVYWAAYVGDKLQSLFLGRAPAMPRSAGRVSRDYLDSYEEMEQWTPYVDPSCQTFDLTAPHYHGRPSYALSTFRIMLELCDIIEVIISNLYSINSMDSSQEHLMRQKEEINLLLKQWLGRLPAWLTFDPESDPVPPPHQITPQ